MNIDFVSSAKTPVPKKYLQDFVLKVFNQLVRRGVLEKSRKTESLVLVFLPKSQARKLNKQFRGKDYATDVLSFDAIEPGCFGELIFCPEVLKKQAVEHGLSYRDELCYMVLHGWLHLLGFEHENGGKEAEKMYSLQDEIFESVLK